MVEHFPQFVTIAGLTQPNASAQPTADSNNHSFLKLGDTSNPTWQPRQAEGQPQKGWRPAVNPCGLPELLSRMGTHRAPQIELNDAFYEAA